jgi:hypothetical protein
MCTNRWLTWLLALMLLLPLAGCGGPAASASRSPDRVVEDFYTWYINYPGNPLVEGAHRSNELLTETFVEKIDAIRASFTGGGYDPVLCAQDVPESFQVGSPEVADHAASVRVDTSFPGHFFGVELQKLEDVWKIADVECNFPEPAAPTVEPLAPTATAAPASPTAEPVAPTAAPGAPLAPGAFQAVVAPELGLAFEVPSGWSRLDPELAWMPDGTPDVRLGFNWLEIQPPMEPEAVLLPDNAQILQAEPVALAWDSGRRFTLEVYGPVAEGKAPVESVETHVLIVISQAGTRYGLDFYGVAPNAERLLDLEPALQHMLQSATLAGTAEQGAAPGAESETANWVAFGDDNYGFEFRYPPDWTFFEVELRNPELDRPLVRVAHFLPQEWAEQMNQGGPPDPSQPPIIAPLALEVSLGTMEDYRRVYIEPTHTDTVRLGENQAIMEAYESGGVREIRYLIQHPDNSDLRITLRDQISGFPERAQGNAGIIETLKLIMATFRFTN